MGSGKQPFRSVQVSRVKETSKKGIFGDIPRRKELLGLSQHFRGEIKVDFLQSHKVCIFEK